MTLRSTGGIRDVLFGVDHFNVFAVELLGFWVARALSNIKRTLKGSFLLARYFLTSGTKH